MRRLIFVVLFACVAAPVPEDGASDTFLSGGKSDTDGIEEGSPTALAVIQIVNTSSEDQLRDDVGLSSHAASAIAEHGSVGSLAELDAIPYVGPIAFGKLVAYARATGLVDGGPTGKLLDCNTSVGPDQQVTVVGDGSSLTLKELTTSGSEQDRALDASEWAARSFMLRDDFGSPTTFHKDVR